MYIFGIEWASTVVLQHNTDWNHIVLEAKHSTTDEPFADFGSARIVSKSSGADTQTCLQKIDLFPSDDRQMHFAKYECYRILASMAISSDGEFINVHHLKCNLFCFTN